ncbi:hypothetical protein VCSRO12_1179 [Vibrio cholerae]|uniref:DUF4282 domain-containing protein n=1 Tax=Vibrio cholerae TaxID=666 RepID=UPI0011DA2232|nr:DUF4282 domain-containing protein [Vibrio cholerae]ELL3752067.1 DUF4282 domain-containing protein [Vibrio cholerae]TXX84646.1 DUF4282 domain-containing protein [Vibrio cholerae]TXZ91595.1 DUF4282 domain-containing protein [Vibrio cholerae]GHY56345.1 hypothetical protein VCSRO119_3696 [Vibrio cholerae]GHY61626.1 hypothetical protein VCSRO12_1179 [Vibrio cholerae]
MKSLFLFEKMLTPKLVVGIYWCLLAIAFSSGIGVIWNGRGSNVWSDVTLGLVIALSVSVAARVWCEFVIVIFKINENLQKKN